MARSANRPAVDDDDDVREADEEAAATAAADPADSIGSAAIPSAGAETGRLGGTFSGKSVAVYSAGTRSAGVRCAGH